MNILTAKFDSEEEDDEYVPKEDMKKNKKGKEREQSDVEDSPSRAKQNAEIDLIWQEMLNEESVPAPKYQKTGETTAKPVKSAPAQATAKQSDPVKPAKTEQPTKNAESASKGGASKSGA